MKKKTWLCVGYPPVEANTKSEARAKFKEFLQEVEALTFQPRKITRLPKGTKVIVA